MKQAIIRGQWDELTDDEKWVLLEKMFRVTKENSTTLYEKYPEYNKKVYKSPLDLAEQGIWGQYETFNPPTIGQLIEFLGDDLGAITDMLNGLWGVGLKSKNLTLKSFYNKELIDALWEATKIKI